MDDLLPALIPACALALVTALGVVTLRRPIYAAMSLLGHTLSLAALFAILGAGMVATGQIIVYSGAIVVLFLFVVTLLPAGGAELETTTSRVFAAIIASGAVLAGFGAAIAGGVPRVGTTPIGGVADIGRALFGPLLLPFELAAGLLLVAVIGAVVIWRRYEPQSRTVPQPKRQARREVVMHR